MQSDKQQSAKGGRAGVETGGGEGRALVRASSNAGKLTSGGRRQLAMKMLTKVGEILEKYKRCL